MESLELLRKIGLGCPYHQTWGNGKVRWCSCLVEKVSNGN